MRTINFKIPRMDTSDVSVQEALEQIKKDPQHLQTKQAAKLLELGILKDKKSMQFTLWNNYLCKGHLKPTARSRGFSVLFCCAERSGARYLLNSLETGRGTLGGYYDSPQCVTCDKNRQTTKTPSKPHGYWLCGTSQKFRKLIQKA